MAFIVTESCIKCKHTDCVEVCPVDCFYEGPNFLVIHPDECIDCALCEPECPVDAIFSEDELPDDQIGTKIFTEEEFSYGTYSKRKKTSFRKITTKIYSLWSK